MDIEKLQNCGIVEFKNYQIKMKSDELKKRTKDFALRIYMLVLVRVYNRCKNITWRKSNSFIGRNNRVDSNFYKIVSYG